MGIGWNQISMERLERPQQLNKKLSGQCRSLVQTETGSILSGVRQSTKTINVSIAVLFRSKQLPVLYLHPYWIDAAG
jgi:hypothetical protein